MLFLIEYLLQVVVFFKTFVTITNIVVASAQPKITKQEHTESISMIAENKHNINLIFTNDHQPAYSEIWILIIDRSCISTSHTFAHRI